MEILGMNIEQCELSPIEYRNGEQLTGIMLDLTEVLPKADGVRKLLYVTADNPPRMIPFTSKNGKVRDGHELNSEAVEQMSCVLPVSIFTGNVRVLKIELGKPQKV